MGPPVPDQLVSAQPPTVGGGDAGAGAIRLGTVRLKSGEGVLAALGAVIAVIYTAFAVSEPADAAGWAQAVLSWGFVAALAYVRARPRIVSALLMALNTAWSLVWILAPVNVGYTLWIVTVPLAVYVARRYGGTRFGRWVLLAAAAWAFASPFMWTWDERLVLFYRTGFDATLTLGLHWAVATVAYLVGSNLDAEAEARERAAREREERLLKAREEERLAVAGDIHDLLGHTLTLIKVQANAGLAAGKEREALEQISAVSGEVLTDIRQLVRGLRESDGGFAPAAGLHDIPAAVERFRASGVNVTLDMSEGIRVPAMTGVAAYRIVVEAVANAARHQVDPVVSVRVAPGEHLMVTVESVGRVSPQPGAGTGLESLRERAASTGGTLTVEQAGDTFTVRAELDA